MVRRPPNTGCLECRTAEIELPRDADVFNNDHILTTRCGKRSGVLISRGGVPQSDWPRVDSAQRHARHVDCWSAIDPTRV